MNYKNTFYLILIVTFFSCGKEEKIPNDIIVEDKMIEILTEIEITQALVKLKFSHQDTIIDQKVLFNDLYHKLNITQEQFNTSLDYYSQQPKVIEDMYVKVISKLSEKQAAFQ